MSGAAFLSGIDGERFGIRVARASQMTQADFDGVLNFCALNTVDLLIARCSTHDLSLVKKMEAQGFFLTDTLVYYGFNFSKTMVPEDQSRVRIRSIRDEDYTRVCEIAAASFKGYQGHYHADARLDRVKCDEAYISWAARSCTMKEVSSEVIVAEHEGKVAGFATLRLNSSEEGEGVLFGVSPEAQGLGIYRAFMINGLRWCKEQGTQRMVVSTQITNIAVQKVWCRVNFEPTSSFYTFHKWFSVEGT